VRGREKQYSLMIAEKFLYAREDGRTCATSATHSRSQRGEK